MKLKSHIINVGYPVYGASFANDHTVIVAGGGGDGNNGIPNKMTAILVQPENTKKPLKRYRELTLNENEDSVMSMDYGNGIILTGINENPLMMAKGVNKHLRKFKFEHEHLKFVESVQIHPNASSNVYQKITMVSQDGSVGVIVMSDTPSSVYIIDCSSDLEEKFKVVADGDVKDITISQDGKLMCYITASDFEVISLITGRSVFKTKLNFIMSKVRFLDNNEVIIAGCKDNGVYMARFSIVKSKVVQEKAVFKNVKGVTSMDVNINNNLTALATSSYSLLLVRTSDFKVIKVLNKVHEFAITKVVFSENGKYLASCSAANTVNVVELPNNLAASKSLLATVFQYLISIVLVAVLSISVQYLYQNGYVDIAIEKVQEVYEAYKPKDSSSYFTIESIASFESITSTNAESTFSVTNDFESSTESASFLHTYVTSETPLVEIKKEQEEEYTKLNEDAYKMESANSTLISDPTIETSIETISEKRETTDCVPVLEDENSYDTEDIERLQDYTVKGDEIQKSGDRSATNIHEDTVLLSTGDDVTEEFSSTSTSMLLNEGFSSESNLISESFKEVTKEVTSVVVSTSVAISTLVETSTSVKVLTEVETSTSIDFTTSVDISTAIETSVVLSTQVVVQTIIKEIINNVTSSQDPDLHIQIEPTSIIFDDYKSASIAQDIMVNKTLHANITDTSNVLIESVESEIVHQSPTLSLELNSDVIGSNQRSQEPFEADVDNENLSIQILPDFEVFDDPEEAIKEEERKIVEELETHGKEYNIQIEPEHAIFENEVSANEEQERLVMEELIKNENENSRVIATEDTETRIDEDISDEDTSSLKTKHKLKHRKFDITPITPIVRLQQETPDVDIPKKDEL